MIFDPLFLIFAIPGLLIGLFAQMYLKSAYGKYSQIRAGSNMTGMDAAKLLNEKENFKVGFKTTPGQLNDHFDPVNHIINLSEDNATNMSVANIAVVAHEFGHVQQKAVGSTIFGLRSALVPVVNIGSNLGIFLVVLGLMLSFTGLAWLGLFLFSFTTIFTLVTLPLELDASRRAMILIDKYNLVSPELRAGAREVLTAAALTYVAALVASAGQLLYYFMLVQNSSRD